MKKILIGTFVVIVCVLMLVGTVGATSTAEDYSYKYVLGDKTTFVHYTKFNYTNSSGDQTNQYQEWRDTVSLSYFDENGNRLTEVPMWEYDEEDGKYYGLVWYIVDQEFTNTWADQYVWAQGPNGYGNQYDTEGDQRPKYTSAVYTLASVRAVDLTYEMTTETKDFKITGKNKDWTWNWDRNGSGEAYKVLRRIYLDAEKTIKLQAPEYGSSTALVDAGYDTYEKQWQVVGDRIVAANLKELDFQAQYYHWSNPCLWAFVSNLQCLWYPDTVLYLQSNLGAGIREVRFDGIEVIACQMFRDCKHITEFRAPASCKYLGDEMFRGSGLQTIRYGENIEVVNHSIFSGITPTNYYLTTNFLSDSYITGFTKTSWGYGYIFNNTKANIYFVGSLSEAEQLWERMAAENTSYSSVRFYDYNDVKARETSTGVAIFYNYNKCDALYEGSHVAGTDVLSSFVGQAFASEYKIYTQCGRACGEENVIEVVDKLIHTKGYSTSEIPGSKAMMHSFVVDKSLVAKYQVEFADLKFGVLAVGENANAPFNGSLIDAQGNKAHEKIAMVDFTEKGFDEIEIKIGGLDSYENTNLYFCGFVIGGENVYYIENDTIKTQAETVTYNDVCAILIGTGNKEENENV